MNNVLTSCQHNVKIWIEQLKFLKVIVTPRVWDCMMNLNLCAVLLVCPMSPRKSFSRNVSILVIFLWSCDCTHCFCNRCISYERSFSRLKLLKTYLRSTMTQDRLFGVATLSWWRRSWNGPNVAASNVGDNINCFFFEAIT